MCPFILDFECQACFITDLRQVFNRVGYVFVCMKIAVMEFPKFSGKNVTGPLLTAWQQGSPQHPHLQISCEGSLPLPCTLPFHISKIRNAFLLHSPFPGRAVSQAERNVSCVLQESSGEVGTVPTSRDGAGAAFPVADPKGAGAGSSSQRDLESAS